MQVSGKDQGLATGLVPITSRMIEPFACARNLLERSRKSHGYQFKVM
jgi:hypothetical protein